MAEGRYLIEAVARSIPEEAVPPRWRGALLPGLDARIAWLLDLFERLERRDRLAQLVPAASRRSLP
jgi:hypothetical protein